MTSYVTILYFVLSELQGKAEVNLTKLLSRLQKRTLASWPESVEVDHVIGDVVHVCASKSRLKSVLYDL